ncbi:MAG: cell division protein FtsA [Thermacetogeniaceae bacterium]
MGREPKLVFALDTGTRSVVGLVLEIGSEGMRLLASAVEEHNERAMLDGQIHDVEQVAKIVIKVKKKLEEKLGISLKKVAVAAAGRALITVRQAFEQEMSPWSEIRGEQVRSLELEAVRKAHQMLVKSREVRDRYYCVGYAVVSYKIDGQRIGNPVGQRGSLLGTEVIATFLPQIVVDSLIAVLERADLEIDVMTLEPIAAMELVVSPTMRHLNLALVDIGAGTSDIAIIANGSVIGFAMVPLAGDEVTEKLCNSYLLDFMTGEKVKRRLRDGGVIAFKDVLGATRKVSSEEMIESIRETVSEIAHQIANTIIRLNDGPPQAVLCIGGGSLTPCLTDELARFLGLPAERVAVRSAGEVVSVKGLSRRLSGPEGVTPLGIALIGSKPQALTLTQVEVNGRSVRLFRGRDATVADALLAAGVGFTDLCGGPESHLTVEVNGELRVIKNKANDIADIYLNGVRVGLDELLSDGAVIKVERPKEKGKLPVIKDLLPHDLPSLRVVFNGEVREIKAVVLMNGKSVPLDTPVEDHAVINWHLARTVKDALLALGFSEQQISPRKVRLTFDGEVKEFELYPFRVYRNYSPAALTDEISDGDVLSYEGLVPRIKIKDLLEQEGIGFLDEGVRVYVNGEAVEVKTCAFRVLKNGVRVEPEETVEDGDEIVVVRDPGVVPIFADIFNFIKIEMKPPNPAARLVMLLNGKDAQYTAPIKNGDEIRIYWEDMGQKCE